MKAAVLHELHKPLSYEEVPEPQLSPNCLKIQLHASALNHRDWWIQKGQYAGIRLPVILGSDGAGIVIETNPEDAEWLGKPVLINPSMGWGTNPTAQAKSYKILGMPDHGTFAERIVIEKQYVFPTPEHLSDEEAAAIPLAGLTAYRALFTRGQCRSEDKVLITGIGGGVALFALQWALAIGAKVWVTSGNDDKIQQAIQLGAQGGTNYKHDRWRKNLQQQVEGFDLIIDSAGGDNFKELIELAAPGGRIVFYGATLGNFKDLPAAKIFWKQLSILGSTMGNDHEFQQMLELINKHQIRPVISHRFPLSEAENALRTLDNQQQFGKIVLVHSS